jgi:hypothetical protein
MKPFGYYEPGALTATADYTTVYVHDRGKLIWEGTLNGFKQQRFSSNLAIQKVVDIAKYNKHQQEYNQKRAELRAEFQKDLFEEFGVTDHPKAVPIYNYVCSKHPHYTFTEIYDTFGEIVGLLVKD